jgi:hypothetical protein
MSLTSNRIIENKQTFINQISMQELKLLNENKVASSEKMIAKFSKDIKIFARIRPMLPPEISSSNFVVVKNNSTKVVVFEPSFSLTVFVFSIL